MSFKYAYHGSGWFSCPYACSRDPGEKCGLVSDITFFSITKVWMMLQRVGLILLLALASSGPYAAELQRITLHDGSSVNAEVLSLNNGVYTLRSPALGKVTVAAGQVQTIQSIRIESSPGQYPVSGSNFDMEQIQSSILANANTVKLVMALQNDPSVKAILADSEIMDAIQRGDYESLVNNPKIKRLMNKAEIKQITGSMAR